MSKFVSNRESNIGKGDDSRSRKRNAQHRDKLMRGNRSVFEIQKSIVKRGKAAK